MTALAFEFEQPTPRFSGERARRVGVVVGEVPQPADQLRAVQGCNRAAEQLLPPGRFPCLAVTPGRCHASPSPSTRLGNTKPRILSVTDRGHVSGRPTSSSAFRASRRSPARQKTKRRLAADHRHRHPPRQRARRRPRQCCQTTGDRKHRLGPHPPWRPDRRPANPDLNDRVDAPCTNQRRESPHEQPLRDAKHPWSVTSPGGWPGVGPSRSAPPSRSVHPTLSARQSRISGRHAPWGPQHSAHLFAGRHGVAAADTCVDSDHRLLSNAGVHADHGTTTHLHAPFQFGT